MAKAALLNFIIYMIIFYILLTTIIILILYKHKEEKNKKELNKIILFNPETKDKKIIESLEDIKKDIGKKAYNDLKQFMNNELDLYEWIALVYKDYIII